MKKHDINDDIETGNYSFLHLICLFGTVELLKICLAKNPDFDKNSQKGTPLEIASMRGDLEILTELVNSMTKYYRETARVIPIRFLRTVTIDSFLEKKDEDTETVWYNLTQLASKLGCPQFIKEEKTESSFVLNPKKCRKGYELKIQKGANDTWGPWNQFVSLVFQADSSNADEMQEAMCAEPKPNRPHRGGIHANTQKTLLKVVQSGNEAVLSILLNKFGSQPINNFFHGETVLSEVAKKGDIAMAKLLLEHGAPVTEEVLTLAMTHHHFPLVEFLTNQFIRPSQSILNNHELTVKSTLVTEGTAITCQRSRCTHLLCVEKREKEHAPK